MKERGEEIEIHSYNKWKPSTEFSTDITPVNVYYT
jgi:hypothetical protein